MARVSGNERQVLAMQQSGGALCEEYDVAMLDLDGVVYVEGDQVPGAPAHIQAARDRAMRVAFITNNASRTPQTVAEHLRSLGVSSAPGDVVTSAQAAAGVLAGELGQGARVALLGGEGLREALLAVNLEPVEVGEEAEALVSGYGPEVRWRDVMRAAVLIREGLWWVASNTDMTIPTTYGVAPGHGVMVETLRRFSEVDPVVAGKPSLPLLKETVSRMSARRPLMVGDRLDTDIAGGIAMGVDTLLVLTGVTGLAELVAAQPTERPTYLSLDLAGLTEQHPGVRPNSDGSTNHGGWTVKVDAGACHASGVGTVEDWWRAVAVTSWDHLDRTGVTASIDELRPPS